MPWPCLRGRAWGVSFVVPDAVRQGGRQGASIIGAWRPGASSKRVTVTRAPATTGRSGPGSPPSAPRPCASRERVFIGQPFTLVHSDDDGRGAVWNISSIAVGVSPEKRLGWRSRRSSFVKLHLEALLEFFGVAMPNKCQITLMICA